MDDLRCPSFFSLQEMKVFLIEIFLTSFLVIDAYYPLLPNPIFFDSVQRYRVLQK
jgi:hypothetical protein